ncbi:hypothetical protein HG530_012707 [Fusarium avenaceum]|nr:hypothetical protein HG530_012707 [Fusarium avenaceum]
MPSQVAILSTLVLNGSMAKSAVVRIVRGELSTACGYRQLAVVVLDRIEVAQVVKKLIMSEAGNKRQKLLRDTNLVYSAVLRL